MDNLKEKKISFKKFLAFLALTVLVTSVTVWQVAQSTPTSSPYYLDTAQESNSYIIFKEGLTYYAKNGSTGQIDFQSTNASYVGNSVLGSLSGISQETVLIKDAISIDSPLLIQKNYTTLLYNKITAMENMTAMISFADTTISHKYITVSGIDNSYGVLNGNSSAVTTGGIRFDGSASYHQVGCNFQNLYIENCALQSFQMQSAYEMHVSNLQIEGGSDIGINLTYCWDNWLDNVIVSSTNGRGLSMYASGTSVLNHFYLGGSTLSGAQAYLDGCWGIEFTDLRIDYCQVDGMYWENVENCTVNGLHVTTPIAASKKAFSLLGCKYNLVSNFQIFRTSGGTQSWDKGIYEASWDGHDCCNGYINGQIEATTPLTLDATSSYTQVWNGTAWISGP